MECYTNRSSLGKTGHNESAIGEIRTQRKKEFGTVTLVAKNKIFYDYNGESRCKFGSFNVKVGDKVEV